MDATMPHPADPDPDRDPGPRRPPIDKAACDAAFARLTAALERRSLSEALAPRRELLAQGILIVYPSPEALAREGRGS